MRKCGVLPRSSSWWNQVGSNLDLMSQKPVFLADSVPPTSWSYSKWEKERFHEDLQKQKKAIASDWYQPLKVSIIDTYQGFPCGSDGKESACNPGNPGSISGLGRSPGGRKWQSTSIFLPGEFHGQRSLVDYSPWGCKQSDTTEWLTLAYLLSLVNIISMVYS